MILQIHGILILTARTTLLMLLLLLGSVVSFSGSGTGPPPRLFQYHRRDTICTRPPFGFLSPACTDRRQCCLHQQARAGNAGDEFDDDNDYYNPPPSSSPSSSSSMPPSRPRQLRRQESRENDIYEYKYEEDKDLPFTEPLRTSAPKLARLEQVRRKVEYEEDDDDDGDDVRVYYYEDIEEDYEYEDDDGEYDDYDDDEEDTSAGGNFWSNPTGGIDRSRKPPSVPSPRVIQPRRRPESINDPRSRPRRRSPVRSEGLNQPPVAAKDFYDRLFWYGFNPDDSEQVGDRTVFGGTKGKFNGLAFLQASDVSAPSRSIRSRQEQRQLSPSRSGSRSSIRNRRKEYYEEEEDYDDEFYVDEDKLVVNSKQGGRPPPEDNPTPRNERNEQRSRVRATSPPPPPPRRRRHRPQYYDDDDYDNDDEVEDDRIGSDVDWVSKQVSSWFSGNDNDDYDDRSTGRQGRRRQRSDGGSEWSPFNVLNAFFGVDPDDMAYKADAYNSKMGIGPKSPTQPFPASSSGPSKRQQRRKVRDNPGRPGYAYRYNAENDMDDEEASFVVDIEPLVIEEGSSLNDKNIGKAPKSRNEENDDASRRGKELTWEERALAVERVPPADITGWGPSGELPIDGRTKAIMDALEDIQIARQKVEVREKKEALAKEEITILKVDAELQRRQLEDSRTNARRAQERLRQIELDIDGASRVLRRARTRVQLARDQLAELQARHWAVLGFYNPDQAEEKVAEALNEFRLVAESPASRSSMDELNSSTSTTPMAQASVAALRDDPATTTSSAPHPSRATQSQTAPGMIDSDVSSWSPPDNPAPSTSQS